MNNERHIASVLNNGKYLFGVGGARRRPHRVPSLTKSTSDCAVLLRSRRTKRSGIIREMSLSMRVPSVSPRGAVPWVPSNEVQRGHGIWETHEEGGKLHFIVGGRNAGVSGKRG